LRTKFLALNVNFSSLSPDPARLKEAGAGGRQRRLPQSGYFTAVISCSVKMVADKHRHAAYHNKHW